MFRVSFSSDNRDSQNVLISNELVGLFGNTILYSCSVYLVSNKCGNYIIHCGCIDNLNIFASHASNGFSMESSENPIHENTFVRLGIF